LLSFIAITAPLIFRTFVFLTHFRIAFGQGHSEAIPASQSRGDLDAKCATVSAMFGCCWQLGSLNDADAGFYLFDNGSRRRPIQPRIQVPQHCEDSTTSGVAKPRVNPWRRLAIFTVSPMMVNDMAYALPTSPTNDRT
jgi:hypothetical protein